MAIVCCNLLLGYTLLKTDAASVEGNFILSANGVKLIQGSWESCYKIIKSNPETTYTLTMQSNWYPTEQVVLDDGGMIILDLNGYTIDGSDYPNPSATDDSESFIYKSASSTTADCELEITDTSSLGMGMICNFNTTLICLNCRGHDTLKISGGTFTRNNLKQNYCSLVSGSASITIDGGIFTDNYTIFGFGTGYMLTINGGEFYDNCFRYSMFRNGTALINDEYRGLTMTGGKIFNNTAVGNPVSWGNALIYATGIFQMSGGVIFDNTLPDDYFTMNIVPSSTMNKVEITGGRFSGTINSNSDVEFELGSNMQQTDAGYVEKVHNWGEWVVDENPTPDHAGSGHHECTTCYQTQSEDITLTFKDLIVTDNKKSYADGDTADLSVNAVYTRSDNNTEVPYKLTNDDYEITYSNGDALVVGENTVTITYQGQNAEITIEVAEEPDEPEVPGDGEVETPTTPDNQPTPEAPKAETPNNTPWIMLFVGIGVGAVLLVGGITLGVVLSKRKK